MRYRLLGPLEVVGIDGRRVKLGGDKERVVLAMLLLGANQVIPTSRLIDAVWGQRPPANASNTLQAHVSRLRKKLMSVSGCGDVVHTAPHGYFISVGSDELDVSDFERLVGVDGPSRPEVSSRLEEALALWRGPALADIPSDLLAGEAARLDELRLVALERRIEVDLSLGRHKQLIPELEALVRDEPLREGLRRQLMLALYRAGRQAEALAEYRSARAVLADELGIDPGTDLQALELAILRQAPEIGAPGQPGSSEPEPDAQRDGKRGHNLTTFALTSFQGREREMASLESLLGRYRLVTVVGPGGSGKTRLAIETARHLIDRFQHGAWLVELAPLDDPGLVPVAVASVLGIPQLSDAPLVDVLAESAAGRDMLLLLDNCEHVIDGAAELCDRLLRAGAGPRLLVTSREALGVEGEARFPLGPLAVPPTECSAQDAASYDSVALFMQRAELADTGFSPSTDAAEVAAKIVRRLDGMPLAIELAAAQVDALSLDQLVASLDDRFRVLVSPTRAAEARQASLAAAVEWSYRLLDPVEQEVFKRVSVFPAPFTLDAASAAAGVEAMDVVPRLVRRSVLVGPRPGPDGRSRYAMLETLRAYAAMRLDEGGNREPVTATVTSWAVTEAQRIAAGFDSSTEEMAAARWMDTEQENLRAMLEWALVHDGRAAVRLAIALGPWWHLRSRWREAAPILERARTAATNLSVEEEAVVEYWSGWLAAISGEYQGTLERLRRAASLISDLGPSRLLVDCWIGQSNVLNNTGRRMEASEIAERALEMAQAIDYPTGKTLACLHLATASLYAGDYHSMLSWAQSAQTIPTEKISGSSARIRTVFLGIALEQTGDLDQAKQTYTEGLALARHAGDSLAEGFQLLGLARIAMITGRRPEACLNLDAALQLTHLKARWVLLFDALQTTAALAAESAPEDALTLFASAQSLCRSQSFSFEENASDEDLHKPLEQARRKLGPDRTHVVEVRGAGMTLAEAVEYARGMLRAFVSSADHG